MKRDIVRTITEECIAVRVRALNRVISARYDNALRPFGIRISQLNILVAVARMGSARPADVCRVLRMDKSTLSRDVELMRRNGWLEIDDSGEGRLRPLRISAAGSTLLNTAAPAWRKAQDEAVGLIGQDGASAVMKMIRRLRTDDSPGL